MVMISVFLCSWSLMAKAPSEVAKAIILKGNVSEVFTNDLGKKESRTLKRGDNIHEGAQITCDKSGFVKLLFFDKSQMMISPGSSIEIKSFTKKKAGMISLLKGRIRSKVTKDRMKIEKEDTSKLFIKTKTAAMGVRGTDFQVIFNPKNDVTSLLTFEGAVAMAKIDSARDSNRLGQDALESRLNSDQAVMVRRGQYSGSMPGTNRVSLPVKISPAQLEVLRGKNEVSSKKESLKKKGKQVVRSTVPPGLNPKKVATKKDDIIQKMAGDKLGVTSKDLNSDHLKDKYFENVKSEVPPEGIVNSKTGEHAPPAGGYIDSKTGLYVPPGKGDAFDPDAGVYVPGPEVGSIDSQTGDYVAPEGTQLADNGSLVKMDSSQGRGPASVGAATVIKNINQNEFFGDSVKQDQSYQSEGKGTSIDLNDYKKETVINYNDNTNILNRRTQDVERKNIKIEIKR